jgi:hypothetical protein
MLTYLTVDISLKNETIQASPYRAKKGFGTINLSEFPESVHRQTNHHSERRKIMSAWYRKRFRLAVAATVLISGYFIGCQSKLISYEGTVAKQEENIVLMESGPHEGIWQNSDLHIIYSYTRQADTLQIQGDVDLTYRLANTFRTVSHFSVRANFLDQDKNILKSIVIVASNHTPIRKWLFNNNFQPPAGITAMNFSYAGLAKEGGTIGHGKDGMSMYFWKVP